MPASDIRCFRRASRGPPRWTCSAQGTSRSTTMPPRPSATPPETLMRARNSSMWARSRRSSRSSCSADPPVPPLTVEVRPRAATSRSIAVRGCSSTSATASSGRPACLATASGMARSRNGTPQPFGDPRPDDASARPVEGSERHHREMLIIRAHVTSPAGRTPCSDRRRSSRRRRRRRAPGPARPSTRGTASLSGP